MKKSSDYFKKRNQLSAIYRAYNSAEERAVALLRLYKKAAAEIESEVLLLYAKGAENGVLSLSDSHNIKRLKQLEQKIKDRLEKLAEQTENTTKESMKQGFEEVYSSISELFGNIDFAMPSPKLMEQILDTPWRGSTFSKRVWKNQDLLAKTLNHELKHGLIQGKTIAQMAVAVDNIMQKGFNNAHRLVRTETMHYLNEANKRAMLAAGIEYFQFYTAENERVCDVCASFHERVYQAGKEPELPLHPNCQCAVQAYDPEIEAIKREIELEKKQKNGYNQDENGLRDEPTVKLPDGSIGKLKEGTTITKVVVFAGKGTSKPVKIADILSERFQISAEEWMKVRGEGIVDIDGGRRAELHWYEAEGSNAVFMKVKRWFDGKES